MREIPVSDGRRFTLHPLAQATPAVEAILIWGLGQCHLVEVDFEGCLSPDTVGALSEKGLGTCDDHTIFGNAPLAKAIFGWDCSEELRGLQEHLAEWKGSRGLDVGCGYGRLLLPLVEFGFTLDGVDQSLPLIKDLNNNLGPGAESRCLQARIEEYVCPQTYAFAYAAMNTVRYLQTKFALRSHLKCMENNLQSGGIYLFCISLVPNPTKPYRITWRFMWDGREHEVRWSFYSYCHLREQITELIEIWDTTTETIIHHEYQLQANYSLSYLRSVFERRGSPWHLEGSYTLKFHEVALTESTRGTYWFKLRRI